VYISSLLDETPTSANAEYYAKIVEQKSLLRKLIRASSNAISLCYDAEQDAYEVVDEAEKLIFDVTERKGVRGYFPISEVIKDSITAIEKLFHRGDNYTGIPSGFKELDDLTSGFQRSEFIVVAARPSYSSGRKRDVFSRDTVSILSSLTICSSCPPYERKRAVHRRFPRYPAHSRHLPGSSVYRLSRCHSFHVRLKREGGTSAPYSQTSVNRVQLSRTPMW